MVKNITYAGKDLFKLDFELYGYEDIEPTESKVEILNAFKEEYEEILKGTLKVIGLEFKELSYYFPKYYNFETDSVDLTICVKDKKLFKNYILKHKDEIQKELDANQSYDGYMATTTSSVESELEDLEQPHYEPDVIVLSVILRSLINFEDFDINDYLVYELEEVTE